MPHFLHPTEELYGGIKDKVADYKTPAFDSALLKLAGCGEAEEQCGLRRGSR